MEKEYGECGNCLGLLRVCSIPKGNEKHVENEIDAMAMFAS